MKVYSPSQTISFDTCPLLRQTEYGDNWKVKIAGKPQIAAMMGTAMAAGIADYYRPKCGQKATHDSPTQSLLHSWDYETKHFCNSGGVLEDEVINRLPPLMTKALDYYMTHDPVPTTWEILGVEYSLPESGYARPDLIVRIPGLGIAPVDHKWKESLYVRYNETKESARQRTLLEYKDDWKMLHYCWAIQRHFGEPCLQYVLILGELTPSSRLSSQRFEVNEEVLLGWEASAQQHWQDMQDVDAGVRVPAMATKHETKYGPCPFYLGGQFACLRPELLHFNFIQVERQSGRPSSDHTNTGI